LDGDWEKSEFPGSCSRRFGLSVATGNSASLLFASITAMLVWLPTSKHAINSVDTVNWMYMKTALVLTMALLVSCDSAEGALECPDDAYARFDDNPPLCMSTRVLQYTPGPSEGLGLFLDFGTFNMNLALGNNDTSFEEQTEFDETSGFSVGTNSGVFAAFVSGTLSIDAYEAGVPSVTFHFTATVRNETNTAVQVITGTVNALELVVSPRVSDVVGS